MDSWVTGPAIYAILWWLVIFMVLPFGVRRPEPHELEKGQEPGAPVKPRMLIKIIVTSVITGVIYGILYLISEAGWISFRE